MALGVTRLRNALKKTLRKAKASAVGDGNATTVRFVKRGQSVRRDLDFDGTVQIDGSVEGRVRGDRVLVTAHATVDGPVQGKTVRIDGTVNGPIDGDTIILAPTACVKGNVNYKSLTIVSGASVFGLCRDQRQSAVAPFGRRDTDTAEPIPFHRIKKSPMPKRLAAARPANLPSAPERTPSMKDVWRALHRAQTARH